MSLKQLRCNCYESIKDRNASSANGKNHCISPCSHFGTLKQKKNRVK